MQSNTGQVPGHGQGSGQGQGGGHSNIHLYPSIQGQEQGQDGYPIKPSAQGETHVIMPPGQGQGGGVGDKYTGQAKGEWSVGLCRAMTEDCSTCCLGCWCPCVVAGRLAEVRSKGAESYGSSCSINAVAVYVGVLCIASALEREKTRKLYNIKGDFCSDVCVHCWCGCCAQAQEMIEHNKRAALYSQAPQRNTMQ